MNCQVRNKQKPKGHTSCGGAESSNTVFRISARAAESPAFNFFFWLCNFASTACTPRWMSNTEQIHWLIRWDFLKQDRSLSSSVHIKQKKMPADSMTVLDWTPHPTPPRAGWGVGGGMKLDKNATHLVYFIIKDRLKGTKGQCNRSWNIDPGWDFPFKVCNIAWFGSNLDKLKYQMLQFTDNKYTIAES